MSLSLNINIIRIILLNLDTKKTIELQIHIKNIFLLESVLSIYHKNLYEFKTMKYITTLKIPQYVVVWTIEILPNGNLIMDSNDGLIKVFDPRNNFICVKELHQHNYSVCDILILKNRNILSRSSDKLILWD
jgi:WD40 repeat protein